MEGLVDMKHISTKVKEGTLPEDRIREVEERLDDLNEKLDILSDKINDLLDHTPVRPELPPTSPEPIEYDYDDWYSNHGQGD
jgi:hypothetical protein